MGRRIVLTVERMAAGGLGLGRIEGRIVFLPGVLPGEEVEVEVLETRSDYLRAKPLAVLRPHPARVSPPCPLFLVCGGCQLMHADYSIQPTLKAEAALEPIARMALSPPVVKPSPKALHYRDRVRLQLDHVHERLKIGFYAAGSKRLIPIDYCHQLNPEVNRVLPAWAAWLDRLSGLKGGPVQLEALAGPDEEGCFLVLDFPNKPSSTMMIRLAAGPDLPDPIRIFHSVKGRLQLQGAPPLEPGLTWLRMDEIGIRLAAAPGAFAQVNRSLNRVLVSDALEAIRALKPARILDLYCGMGNFSLPLASAAGGVVGVEENPRAVANARLNLRENRVKNVTIVQRDAIRAAAEMADRGDRFDVVVMDPPRAGARGLAMHLARLQPRDILYVSCHPAAMARDLAEFTSLGFEVHRVTAYDMFPQTAHLEVLAHLRRS